MKTTIRGKTVNERERPSRIGVVLGEAVARLAEAGGGGEMCATCAFKPGTMTNQMATTLLDAFKCVIGADPDDFACHHGLEDGRPTKLCAGYLSAKQAPWETVKEVSGEMARSVSSFPDEPDPVRDAFDAWVAEVDPDNSMDDYQRARAYARSFQGRPMKPSKRNQQNATLKAEKRQGAPPRVSKYALKVRGLVKADERGMEG